ncbi:sensor histidine kinase [Fusibacter bizertensis]
MMLFPWFLCCILLMVVSILSIKLVFLKKNMDAISAELAEHLSQDTNTLISVSSRDKHIRHLASELNKQLRILRRQRRQFQSGNTELKEAITNISHDLRTPLTALCGYLELLQNEDQSETVARYLLLIDNRVQALKQLTEELFRYSIIISKQDNMKIERVNVNRVLEESVAEFYVALMARGITPTIQMPEKIVERSLNTAALSRIFSNIISNAIKYSDGDLDIVLLEHGEIIFSNSATNLSEIQVGKLFNRFFSVESARESTGLGLTIAKTLVEHMHGTIKATLIHNQLTIRINFENSKKGSLEAK